MGTDLILLIVSALVAGSAATVFAVARRDHAALRATTTTPARLREPGHYELAYLAGGRDRVADTAVALLATSGDLRVSRGGVHPVRTSAAVREPVDAAVLDVVSARSGLPAGALKTETTRAPAVREIERGLSGQGLIHPDSVFAPVDRGIRALWRVTAAACAGSVVVAVTIVFEGVRLPSSIALAVLVVTVAGAMIAIRSLRRAARDRLTPAGRDTLDAARRDNPRGAGGPVALALYGLGELRNMDLRLKLTRAASPVRRGAGGAYVGGSCGAGVGADGPSGCGGGGCGGCGCGT